MLAIISDLHLSDGTTAANVHETAFDLLGAELKTAAQEKGAKELHLVLLGDIVDLVRTDYWHRNAIHPDARPWGGKLDPDTAMNVNTAETERQFLDILDAILQTPSAQGLLGMIAGLPQATKVTYVVGNHDRVLNNFRVLKDRLIKWLPQSVDLTFDTKLVLPEYKTLCRHGHEWDENCHGWQFMTKVLKRHSTAQRFDPACYPVMAIGEVVTAELMSGLVYHAAQRLDPGKEQDQEFLAALKDVNNVRPMTDVLNWLGWKMRGYQPYLTVAQQALELALDGLLNSSLARRWDELKPDLLVSGDITDWLGRARWVLKRDGIETLSEAASTLAKISDKLAALSHLFTGNGARDPYADGAAEDLNGAADGSLRFVAYGHTHRALRMGITTPADVATRLYINTGTYLPLTDRTLDGKGFWRAYRMAVALCFKDQEDKSGRAGTGPTLDVWDGIRLKEYQEQAPQSVQSPNASERRQVGVAEPVR